MDFWGGAGSDQQAQQLTHLAEGLYPLLPNLPVAELTTGSNTPPTDSTNLLATMQHKFGAALIWRDSGGCCFAM